MEKPKIILADTDESYITPLEMKFLDELRDMADLELITEKTYFDSFFSKPQYANALVISEELYSHELKKQNGILNTFVLSERADASSADDVGITTVFKYTRAKEIYDHIMSKSGLIQDSKKDTIVVLVYSPSGGVGKTTLALGISACFSARYKRTLYIDAERINTFQHRMADQTTIPANMYASFLSGGSAMYESVRSIVRSEHFSYLPPFGAALSSINLDFFMYEELIRSVRDAKEYDVIVVDTDCVFDPSKASLISLADKVILVLDQSKNSVFSMNILMKNMNCNDREKYYFVCSKYDKDKVSALDAPAMKTRFEVDEYVGCIEGSFPLEIAELAAVPEIQKISFLVT